jgi:hypothetical protein
VDDAGDRRARAGADVGCGAGDGAGGGDASEERRDNIGDALGDELDVRVVTVAGHAVGDDGGEHTFKRRQHCHGKSNGDQGLNVFGVEAGQCEGRQAARNAAEFAANGLDWKMEEEGDCRASQDGNDGGGNSASEARKQHEYGERTKAKSQCVGIEAGKVGSQQLHARKELAGNGGGAQAEEVLDLGGGDQDGDAVGEADDHHVGDEAHRSTQTGEAHEKKNDSGHDGDHGEAAHAKTGDDAGDNDDEGAGGSADLGAGAAEGRDEEAGDDGGVETGLGSDSRGNAEGHGEREGDQTYCDASEEVVEKHLARVGTESLNRFW